MNTQSLGRVLTAARSYQQWLERNDKSQSMRDRATGSPFFRQSSPLLSVVTRAKGQQLGACWRQTSNSTWKNPGLGAGLEQNEHHGEAALTTLRLLHLNSRSWCFPQRQDTALRPRVQQNASQWRTISWPALGSQLQASSQNREKHNLSQFPSKDCTSLDYETSQYISTSHKEHISEQSLPKLKQDIKTEQMQ